MGGGAIEAEGVCEAGHGGATGRVGRPERSAGPAFLSLGVTSPNISSWQHVLVS